LVRRHLNCTGVVRVTRRGKYREARRINPLSACGPHGMDRAKG